MAISTAPTTTALLLTHLRHSQLVPREQLDRVAADHADLGPAAFLERLLALGLLTRFQADRIKAGKHKGFILGDYRILDQLGGGGAGQVYLAEHRVMRRLVALKVLSISGSGDPVTRERFFREARVAGGLDHPNIIRLHDQRREGTVFYLVMEYVGGISLQHLVARHGKLDWPTAAHYARQVAIGLAVAHASDLVHRDIKPANLLLGPDGIVKILDLGLVRDTSDTTNQLTEKVDRSILGTADYLAPEQAVNSAKVDIRADLYSLGATFYFLLAGRPMFPDGRTAQKLMWQQLREPTPITEFCPDLPAPLAAFVHQLLAKKPDRRPQSPHDVIRFLDPYTTQPIPPPNPEWLPAHPRRGTGSVSMAPVGPPLMPQASPSESGHDSSIAIGGPITPISSDSTASKSSHLFDHRPGAWESADAMPTMTHNGEATPRSIPAPVRPQTPAHARSSTRLRMLDPTPPAQAPIWKSIAAGAAVAILGLVVIVAWLVANK